MIDTALDIRGVVIRVKNCHVRFHLDDVGPKAVIIPWEHWTLTSEASHRHFAVCSEHDQQTTMNAARRASAFALTFTRSYASKYPRPKPGTAERPPYRPTDPLLNNPNAVVTTLPDEDLTFIHRPPPTAPSPFSLTTAPVSPLLRGPPTPVEGLLPPFIRPSADKQQPDRASDEVVAEIRRLRRLDPTTYTQGKLAQMFGCTRTFVASIAALKKPQRKAMIRARDEKHVEAREKWSEKRSIVRAIRAKRREMW